MGGGVVAQIFRDRRKPGRFSGGGVVAEIFRGRRKPDRFSGGGGSSRNCWASPINKPPTFRGGGVVGEFLGFFGNRRSRSIKLPQFR